MNDLEMAKTLLSNRSQSNPGQTTTVHGIATSDSASGIVMVDMGGDTISPDDDQSIECETTFKVYSGDEVIVSLIGADGSGKTPIIIGVVGRGDQQQSEIDSIKNYFWTDDQGVHVSTEPNSVRGRNILLDSDSLDIRSGNSDSDLDQTVFASFGREVTVGSRDPDAEVGVFSQVFGRLCSAKKPYSRADGFNTVAASPYQMAIGKNNLEDPDGIYALIVGNGEFPAKTETFVTSPGTLTYTLEEEPTGIDAFGFVPITRSMLATYDIVISQSGLSETVIFPYAYDRDLTVVYVVSRTTGGGPGRRGSSSTHQIILPAGETELHIPGPGGVDASSDFTQIELPVGEPSFSGTLLTLDDDAAYWAAQFEGLPITITYTYAGTVECSNAMTLDWEGNLVLAGKLFCDGQGVAPLMDAVNPSAEQSYVLSDDPHNYKRLGFLFGRTADTIGIGNWLEVDSAVFMDTFYSLPSPSVSTYLRLEENGAYLGVQASRRTMYVPGGDTVLRWVIYVVSKSNINYLRVFGINEVAAGAEGTTYTPAVSSEGVLSWTNNGGKANPEPVNIKGGTGAKGDPGITVFSITLPAASWSGTSLTVTAAGVTADNHVLISADPISLAHYTAKRVRCVAQGVDTLTFACNETPASDLIVNVSIWGGESA